MIDFLRTRRAGMILFWLNAAMVLPNMWAGNTTMAWVNLFAATVTLATLDWSEG